jgi:hypothetical protein
MEVGRGRNTGTPAVRRARDGEKQLGPGTARRASEAATVPCGLKPVGYSPSGRKADNLRRPSPRTK